MKKFFRALTIFFAIIFSLILVLFIYGFYNLPSKYIVTSNSDEIYINKYLKVEKSVNAFSSSKIKLVNGNLHNRKGNFKGNNKKQNIVFLNFIPIKPVDINYSDEQTVFPCGTPFGVKIFTQGVLVVGTSEVKSKDGLISPAKNSGIRKGDVILSVNKKAINSNEDLFRLVENCSGKVLNFEILRNNLKFNVDIEPVKDLESGTYKLGAWVRDSSAGIGTLTFHNPETNIFGGLGHGICDIDTGDLLPLSHGDIVRASINGIIKGRKGVPGELKGYFIETEAIGSLLKNTNYGVYGTLKDTIVETMPVKVATKQEIKLGPAQMATTVDGITPKYYSINIQDINYNESIPCKNMVIKITDDYLLSRTGGIIQGMSGSPIIQDGKLVGAVTHVFVNDPTKGYAIFAENMVYNSELCVNNNEIKKAS